MAVPPLSTARAAPGLRGALPPTATTVATAKSRPCSSQRCSSSAMSSIPFSHGCSSRFRQDDAVGPDRQVPVAYTGRMPDGVGHGRRGSHDADLADALDADGIVVVRIVHPVRLDE